MKKTPLKTRRLIVSLVGVLAFAALGATAARSQTTLFTASYAGHVTEQLSGQDVTATALGKGTGTLVKASTVSGIIQATTANPPCSPLSGPSTIKSASGKLKLNVVPTTRACAAGEDDQNNISVSGSVKVVGGTGKFKKARGTLRITGHYDRGSGSFTVKMKGRLTY